MRERIAYSQTWEDLEVLRRALQIVPTSRVLTISSGGGAPITALQAHPASLQTVDTNGAQTHLLQIIAAAAEILSYQNFLGFIGVRPHPDRLGVFRSTIASRLNQVSGVFWRERPAAITQGVIHTGKLERFFRFFAQHILPRLVSRSTVGRLLAASSIDEQAEIYRHSWNSWRWRVGVKFFFSRNVFGHFGRDRMYAHQAVLNPANEYLIRAVRGLTVIPSRSNWMLEYILTGRYQYSIPPAYSELAWESWRVFRQRVRILTDDLSHVVTNTTGTFTQVHLSDIFEGYTVSRFQEFFLLLASKVAPGGRVCFWTNLSTPPIDIILNIGFRLLKEEAAALWAVDRGFFYRDFILLQRTSI